MKKLFKRFGRWLSPSAFGLAVICFAMPFMGVTCADETLFTVNAFDVAAGGVYPKHLEGKTEGVDEEEPDDVKAKPANILMSVALPLFVLAALCATWRNKPGLALTLSFGGAGVLTTILYRVQCSWSFNVAMNPTSVGDLDLSGLLHQEWRYGFWCIILFGLAGLIGRIYYERVRE
ncbi:MAG: hypothetical protein PVH29_01470 [Candidatus Zixiibacteriota bacterium]|jgi:hypothetical protein